MGFVHHGLRLGRVARRPGPHGEGVVGVDAGPPAVAGLRVDEHGVEFAFPQQTLWWGPDQKPT